MTSIATSSLASLAKNDELLILGEENIFTIKALKKQSQEYEKQGELFYAIQSLKQLQKLSRRTRSSTEKIARLQKKMSSETAKHYANGIKLFENNDIRKSREAFLTVLQYNPFHKKALNYLRSKFDNVYINYRVIKGDTAKKIAKKIYKDSSKSVVVEFFVENSKSGLRPRTILRLPLLKNLFAKKKVYKRKAKKVAKAKIKPKNVNKVLNTQLVADQQKHLNQNDITNFNDVLQNNPVMQMEENNEDPLEQENEKVTNYIKEKKYDKALELTEQILDKEPTNFEAIVNRNIVYFEKGKQYSYQNMYEEALKAYSKVSPEFEGIDKEVAYVNNKVNEQLESEIADKNKELYQIGTNLYKQKKYKKALKLLSQLKNDYKDIIDVLAVIKHKMGSLADSHYKNGVVYFVNEDIEKAIVQWKKALSYNPRHRDASKNLKSAQELLKKLKDFK